MHSDEIRAEIRKKRGWAIALGILMMIAGLVAVTAPFLASLAATLLFGWLFVVGGIIQLVHAFNSRKEGQFVWKVLLGLLYIVAGLIVVFYPLKGLLTLTLVLGITIFVQSVLQVIMAFQLRPDPSWGWVLFSGILGIILGIFIWSKWPQDALWILGLWVGLNLVFDGLGIAMLAVSARKPLNQVNSG